MRKIIQGFGQLISPAARRFQQAIDQPERAQAAIHQTICDRLIHSDYGKSLGVKSIADWQRVPIVDYEDLEPWIKRGGLTPEPILFYEKTSGSSGAAKSIPYTRSLRRSFSQMFCVWAHDLIQNGPQFSTGRLYACISPQLGTDALQDDADYLDGWLRWLLSPFLVMPAIDRTHNAQQFQHQLSLALLQAERLETISIWSPSFLQVQLDYIQMHQTELRSQLQRRLSRDRLQLLSEPTIPWTQLWKHLKLISCWDSAQSADRANSLRLQFPNVWVQGKGLLATEAPLTIPLIEAQGCVPVLDQVLFEFEDESGEIHPLHDLSVGQVYTLILSQLGGLYRYRIGDRVQVTHHYRQTPCLAFVGRGQQVSDLVGEKLHAAFVQTALDQLNLSNCRFQSLVPVSNPPHYLLLLDQAAESREEIAARLDRILCRAHHYHHARLLDQLAPPQVKISNQIPQILALSKGSVWGGVKHPILAASSLDAAVLQTLERLEQPI